MRVSKALIAGRIAIGFILINLLIIGAGMTCRQPSGELRITFLDVGQGDSAVIESPSGKVLVVDTGNVAHDGSDNDIGRRVVAPFLRQRGIGRIDVLFLTHPDADHIGGAETLLDLFSVGLLVDNGQSREEISSLAARLVKEAARRKVGYHPALRGQVFDLGDGVRARVLAPTQEEREGPKNDASIVLRVEYGRTAFLLTGDAEVNEEQELVATRQPLQSDVLKVGHHGSLTSTTPEFLAAVRPRHAVISVGGHNLYGHPRREIIGRLQKQRVQVFRTDKQGAVSCISDGNAVRLVTMQTLAEQRRVP